MRKTGHAALLLIAVLVIAALLSWPANLKLELTPPEVDAAPDGWLAAREMLVDAEFGIYAATEKRVRWQVGAAGTRTEFAVVYLHGFSATRQEIAPVAQRLADALGANLFETRLAGHGLKSGQLDNVSAEDWLADTAEAIAVGNSIGKRLILVGTSTGATLAMAAAIARPEDVAALVMISPNFSPRDENADYMTAPGGPLLARLLLGETHSWEPHNAMQARFWTTRYSIASIIEVMRLVKAIRDSLPLSLQQPLLVFLSPDDDVINVGRAETAIAQIDAPYKKVINVDTEHPAHHVLAGDILAPHKTDEVVAQILNFLGEHVPGAAQSSEL